MRIEAVGPLSPDFRSGLTSRWCTFRRRDEEVFYDRQSSSATPLKTKIRSQQFPATNNIRTIAVSALTVFPPGKANA